MRILITFYTGRPLTTPYFAISIANPVSRSYMFVFWILVGTIGVSTRIVASLGRKPAIERSGWQQITLREPVREDQTAFKCLNWIRTPSVWLGRHITLPATFGYRASQNFGWYTVPPRIQTLTILAFTVINIVLCVHGYRVFRGNLYFPEVHTQVWRYLSDRTGIISFANFPLIWLFGMRNNLLLWITGWDFGIYNNFHRWIARIATVEAVVHSIGYTILVFEDGGWPGFVDYWKELWWTTGEIATILMCALIPLSLYWMRRNSYELFLALHILLSVVILAAMWGHVTIFKERYEVVAWICFGIWALDRVLRLVRTLAFNRVPFSTRARATFDPATNMIRLSVPCKTSLYQPTPGTFYYLSVLNDRRFWESHPFTMAKYQTGTDEKRGMGTTEQFLVASETTRLLPQAAADISTASKPSRESAGAEKRTMTFLIRPYDGFTKRLRDAASSTYPHPAYLPILVEGPYGHQRNFDRFDHVVFVVGGSGIVIPLVHLQRLCHSRAGTRSVHILWAVREPAFAMSVLQQDMAESSGKFGSRLLDLNVYITGRQQPEQPLDLPGEVRVYHGRPDVNAMVRGYAQDYSHQGTLAVVSCGPAKMNDDTRRAVVHSLGMGRFALEYFEESFNW